MRKKAGVGKHHKGGTGLASLVFLCALLCSPCGLAVALAAEKETAVIARGDQVEYFNDLQKVVLSGHVTATYQTATLSCDHATIYTTTKDAYLQGRVTLVQPDGVIKGEEVVYNFETRKGTILQAEAESREWRTKGDRAEKISETALAQRSGYLTSCDFEQPHTRFQAKEVRVFLDDKIVLKNVVMYVGNVPVFYLPTYLYPLDDKRPRVSLIPGMTKAWGYFLLSSWRLYVNENLQGRVLADARERVGLAYGEEVKYELPVGGKGIVRSYYSDEHDIQQKHLWRRYIHPEKGTAFTKRDRARFQLRHRWDVDKETQATLEINQRKDPTVIQDFFPEEFKAEQSPQNYFQIVRTTSWFGLIFGVTNRVNKFETVTQQWPSISVDVRPLVVPWLPRLEQIGKSRKGTETEAEQLRSGRGFLTGAGWYYHPTFSYEHSNVSGPKNRAGDSLLKFDTTQEIFYPLRFFRWLNFRPFFKFRETAFSRGAKGLHDYPISRQAAATGFDLSTQFFRTFLAETDFLGLDIHQLRHIVTPTLGYQYQAPPTLSGSHFLRSDDLTKINVLSPGLEHKFQTKRMIDGRLQAVDLARLTTNLPYDLEGANGRGGRLGNLSLDLETKPYPWLHFESDAIIDPHLNYGKPQTFNMDLIATSSLGSQQLAAPKIGDVYDKEGNLTELPWAVGLGWRYQREVSALLNLSTEFSLGPKWRVGVQEGFDVKRFATETTTLGSKFTKKIYDFNQYQYRLRRDLHEWTVELLYGAQRGQGQSIFVVFRLKAAPETPLEFQKGYNRPKAGKNFPKPGEVYGDKI